MKLTPVMHVATLILSSNVFHCFYLFYFAYIFKITFCSHDANTSLHQILTEIIQRAVQSTLPYMTLYVNDLFAVTVLYLAILFCIN